MRKSHLLFSALLLTIAFLYACKKDRITSSVPNIRYKLDNSIKEVIGGPDSGDNTGVTMTKLISDSVYVLLARNRQTNPNRIVYIPLEVDSLKVGSTYRLGLRPNYFYVFEAGTSYSTDLQPIGNIKPYVDLTITSYSNGEISGSFKGILLNESTVVSSDNKSVVLLEGSFNHVQVFYYD